MRVASGVYGASAPRVEETRSSFSVETTIEVAWIDTGVTDRDTHPRLEEHFDFASSAI